MADPKRPRGRPPTPQGAKPRAEVQRAYRERRKAAGKVLRVIDTWAEMMPAEIADMRERLGNALLKLELRERDVARLEARNAHLESELRRVEQHNLNALKDNIVLKKQLAERPSACSVAQAAPTSRRGRRYSITRYLNSGCGQRSGGDGRTPSWFQGRGGKM
jgi:hypothetical protein